MTEFFFMVSPLIIFVITQISKKLGSPPVFVCIILSILAGIIYTFFVHVPGESKIWILAVLQNAMMGATGTYKLLSSFFPSLKSNGDARI